MPPPAARSGQWPSRIGAPGSAGRRRTQPPDAYLQLPPHPLFFFSSSPGRELEIVILPGRLICLWCGYHGSRLRPQLRHTHNTAGGRRMCKKLNPSIDSAESALQARAAQRRVDRCLHPARVVSRGLLEHANAARARRARPSMFLQRLQRSARRTPPAVRAEGGGAFVPQLNRMRPSAAGGGRSAEGYGVSDNNWAAVNTQRCAAQMIVAASEGGTGGTR